MHDSSPDKSGIEKLPQFSADDLKHIGLHQIAYVKALTNEKNEQVFSVHAADGTPLSLADSYAMAVAAVRYHDMYPVTVH